MWFYNLTASDYVRKSFCRQRYEGLHVFSVYSPQDDKVGHRNACGESTSSIAGADQEFQNKFSPPVKGCGPRCTYLDMFTVISGT
uniref:Astacin domain-containing protein n=1 Tax=Angiostrongylus cantonensis TaxID=6313 RepID=A0A0K0DJ84_ANGCA